MRFFKEFNKSKDPSKNSNKAMIRLLLGRKEALITPMKKPRAIFKSQSDQPTKTMNA